jgi:hypothetical protein
MSQDAVLSTIDLVVAQVAEIDQQLLEKKRMVNDLCKLAGRPPMYSDADLASRAGSKPIRPDEYYGKPLATVVRLVLERRDAMGLGAATVNEIYDEMAAGGFHFGGKNDDNNKRGLYVSLGKNSTTFHKLPNGTYGLLEWYPDAKAPKGKNGNGKGEKPLHEELQEEATGDVAEDEVAPQPAKAK